MLRVVPENSDLFTGGAPNQTSLAYESIRTAIVTGRHKPEKKLKIQELAVELKVSPGAVREALSRLVPEGLVVSRDQRGFLVAPLSLGDLGDLTDMRCEIEAIALRRSVERGDINWEASILTAELRLRDTRVVVDRAVLVLNPEWVKNHEAFHSTFVSACGSRRLLALHAQLYEQSERYRGLSADLGSVRDVAKEHYELVQLALLRDSDGLIKAANAHLRRTTAMIVEATVKARSIEPT